MNPIRSSIRLSALAALVALLAGACGDDPVIVEKDLTIRLYHAREGAQDTQAEGFPPSIAGDIFDVRVRIYQNGVERTGLSRTFDFTDPSGAAPQLEFGENYQIVVEALAADESILADGATPEFDYLETANLDEIRVFTSRRFQIEYASALFGSSSGVVSLPSEFEGSEVAVGLGLPRAELGGQRAGHTLTELPDGRVMVIGGARLTNGTSGVGGTPFADFADTIEIYNPATGYWSILRDTDADQIETASGGLARPPMRLSVARAFHTATVMGDGRVLVAGGFFDNQGSVEPSSAAEIIDWREGSIEVLTPGSQDLVEPRALHSAHWVAGRVVLVGGVTRTFAAPGFTSGIEAYNTTDGYFDRLTDPDTGSTLTLTEGRGLHSGTTLGDDGILITGGRTSDGVTNTIEFLEVRDGELHRFYQGALPEMRVARFGHSAVLMQPDFESTADRAPEYLAIAGGFTAVHAQGDAANTLLSGAQPTGSVEFFETWDLALDTSLERELATPRAHFELIETSVTRDLMVFGGLIVNGDGNVVVTRNVERLFRNENGGFPLQVQPFDDQLTQGRAYAASSPIQTHNVLVVGGWDGQGSTAACGEGGAYLAGCTSELANPGDLYYYGYLY